MSTPVERWVVLGRVSGVYGIGGWVRVFSSTEPRDGIVGYPTWYLDVPGGWEGRQLEQGRAQGKGVVAKMEGCDSRDAAHGLIGRQIAVPRSFLPTVGCDEFYWTDLIGLRVSAPDGRVLGVVDALMETGSNDVLLVKGQREQLIPFIMGDVVKQVDLDAGLLTVDWDPDF